MTTIARILLVASLAVGLAGCAPTPTPDVTAPIEPAASSTAEPQPPAPVIPSSCDLPEMVELIEGLGFTGAIDVTPPWEPADGTVLKLALDNGGIACAWGPPNTDAGVVVYWVSVDDELWADASDIWWSEGAGPMDFDGLDEDAGFFVAEDVGVNGNEFARWELNVRYGSLWIQVGTSSWENPSDGNAVVDAALEIAVP